MSKASLQEILSNKYGLKVTLGNGISAIEMEEMVKVLDSNPAAAKIFSYIINERNERASVNSKMNKEIFTVRQQRNSFQSKYQYALEQLSYVRRQLDSFVNGYEKSLDYFLTLENSEIYQVVREVKSSVFPAKSNRSRA